MQVCMLAFFIIIYASIEFDTVLATSTVTEGNTAGRRSTHAQRSTTTNSYSLRPKEALKKPMHIRGETAAQTRINKNTKQRQKVEKFMADSYNNMIKDGNYVKFKNFAVKNSPLLRAKTAAQKCPCSKITPLSQKPK